MRAIRHFFTRHRRDDRGVVAIFTAIAMAVLVGFVGFAVDVGMVFNERRQEQSAVDAAALSGAREFLLSFDDTPATHQEVFDEVARLSAANVANPPSLEDWENCTDPGRVDRGFTEQVISDCVSYRLDDRNRPVALRVRLPDTTVETAFARVVGFSEWTVSATAEAGLTEQPGSPNIIPFTLGAIGDGSGPVCLKTPPNGQAEDDCEEGSTSGNFGYLAIPRPSFPSNQNCNGGHQTVITQNLAQGIDHALSEREGISVGNYTDPLREDRCSEIAAGIEPNHLFGETGDLNDDVVTSALITGTGADFDDDDPARLKRYPQDDLEWDTRCIKGTIASCLADAGGDLIDNKAMWDFFDTSLDFGSDVPATCDPAVIRAADDTRAALYTCLADYEQGGFTAALLTEDILLSPRFTWLPEAWETLDDWSGSGSYDIRRFRPIFLQTLYYTQGSSWWAIDPGVDELGLPVPIRPDDEQPDGKLRGMSAIAMQLDLLPQEIQDEGPRAGNFQSRIALIR